MGRVDTNQKQQFSEEQATEGQPKILDFMHELTKNKDGTGLTFDEKVQNLISILTPKELNRFKGNIGKTFSPAIGNEGLVMMLLESLWMQETEEGREYIQKLRTRNEQQREAKKEEFAIFEMKVQENLPMLKKWLTQCSYSEKLAAVAISQLLNKEGTFDSDKNIGNDIYNKFEESVIASNKSQKYLANALEAAATVCVANMTMYEV